MVLRPPPPPPPRLEPPQPPAGPEDSEAKRRGPPSTLRDWMAHASAATVQRYPLIDDPVTGFGNDDLWEAGPTVAVRRGSVSPDS